MTCHTIRDLLLMAANLRPHQEILRIKEDDLYQKLTCKELAESVRELGNGLLRLGVKKGAKIGIMAENRQEWPIVYLAVTSIGAIITPISILWEKPELEKLANTGHLSFIFTSRIYLDKITAIQPLVPSLQQVICFDTLPTDAAQIPFSQITESGQKSMREGNDLFATLQVNSEDIAEILFVNCTLGVQLSHRAMLANVEGIYNALDINGAIGKKSLLLLPYSHLYPTVFGILLPLLAPWTTITAATARMDHILRIIKETEPHYIFLVPLLLDRFYTRLSGRLKKGEKTLATLGFEHVEWVFTAGAKCPKDLIVKVNELGLRVLEGYGVSEMAPFITMNTPAKFRPGSVGKPLPNVELMIQYPDGAGNGEVTAQGPNMMTGYYNLAEANEAQKALGRTVIDEKGWLHTGDIGRIDEDGFLHITGRSRNILVSKGGTNIYPVEIEAALLKSPYIAGVMVVARWDEINGEYPYAYIQAERKTTATLSDEELHFHIQETLKGLTGQLAAYKIPRDFKMVSDISVYRREKEQKVMFTDLYQD